MLNELLGARNLVPGMNVDRIDVDAGLRELSDCGYTEAETRAVIAYALNRWSRGEEDAAQRGAIDRAFHGVDLTVWLRVLAAARAGADKAPNEQRSGESEGGTP